jgi:antitoxin CptB
MISESLPSDLIRGWPPVFRKDRAPWKNGAKLVTERSSEELDVRRRKLLFRAWRRGVRETDLIVGRFADAYIDKFDTGALDDFERLIEVPNAELYAWVAGDESVPRDFDTAVLRQLIDFHRQGETKQGEAKR